MFAGFFFIYVILRFKHLLFCAMYCNEFQYIYHRDNARRVLFKNIIFFLYKKNTKNIKIIIVL